MNFLCIFKDATDTEKRENISVELDNKKSTAYVCAIKHIRNNFTIKENSLVYILPIDKDICYFNIVQYTSSEQYSIRIIKTGRIQYASITHKLSYDNLKTPKNICNIGFIIHMDCTYKNDLLESFEDKPAMLKYDNKNHYWYLSDLLQKQKPVDERWYKEGKLHRDNAPAQIQKTNTGTVSLYYINGKKVKNPIDIYDTFTTSVDNNRHTEYYFIKNRIRYKKHYFHNILVKEEYFNIKGDHHRDDDLPAIIKYYNTGELEEEQWLINDAIHRVGNPAIIKYMKEKIIIQQNYYLKNRFYDSYTEYINRCKDEFAQEYNAKLKKESVDMFN